MRIGSGRLRRAAVAGIALAMLIPNAASAAPDDPLYDVQWGMQRIGAITSWRVTRGAGSVVAVVDTGIDLRHPDLRDRLVPGRDFVEGDDDPDDLHGHGTHVAGIIAATAANGYGIAGVAPEALLLPVRVLREDGQGRSADVAEGIRYAVSRGASVVNLSLAQDEVGSAPGLPGFSGDLLRDPSVDRAIRDAARAGALVVIAAGNDSDGGQPSTAYDARVDGVLVVGASTPGDARAAYSNYGEGLDLLAPGGGSATVPGGAGCREDNWIISTWWNPKRQESGFGAACGSSMSVGFVSGVGAMLMARGMTNAEAAKRILSTAKDLGPKGRDDETGYGRLDAARALGAVGIVTSPPPARPRASAPAGSATVKAAGSPASEVDKQPSTGRTPGGVESPPLAAGTGDAPGREGPIAAATTLAALVTAWHLGSARIRRRIRSR